MSDRLTLLLLYGGKSGEHEISLISAASVLTHLNAEKYNIIPVGMDKEGRLFVNDYHELLTHERSLPVTTSNSKPLASLLLNGRLALDADVVLPIVHGPLYEDGCLQGLLSLANVAYMGCDVLSSAVSMDKDIARRLACQDDILYAPYRLLSGFATKEQTEQFCHHTANDLGWPLFVKPCSLGSSVGIHKANNMTELLNAIEDARRYDHSILVEAFIQGREIELAVLETSPTQRPKVTVPGEIRVEHQDGFYSYTAKYLESEQTKLFVPALLDDKIIKRLQDMAADIFVRLKCRGLARVDFFVNDQTGDIYFNEINTLPGFTSISMYPKLWQASGLEYADLLDRLIELALMHHQCRQNLVTHYS